MDRSKRVSGIVTQIGGPLLIFLIILITLEQVFLIVYYASNYYTIRRESSLEFISDASKELENYAAIGWLADFWREHYEEMDFCYEEDVLREKEQAFSKAYTGSELAIRITPENISAEPYETQLLYAEICYGRISSFLDRLKNNFNPVYLYMIDVVGDEKVFLLTGARSGEKRISQGGDLYELGVKEPYVKGELYELDHIIENHQSEAEFEAIMGGNVDQGGLFAIAPVHDSNEDIAMIALAYYDWRWFFFRGTGMLLIVAIILICGAILISMWVMHLIRKYVVLPISQEQSILKDFSETKDAGQAVSNLNLIRSDNEIEVLANNFSVMITEIDNYVKDIRHMTEERHRMETELSLARTIQTGTLPMDFPAFPDRNEFDIYASVNPAKETGGDFYDFFFMDEDHLALVIADVSGKGMPAALFMMRALTFIRTRAKMPIESPVDIISDVNKWLCERNEQAMFVTAWLAVLDVKTGKGIEVNAGHEDPVIKRAGGQYELIEYEHSSVLAIIEDMQFKEHPFELHPGDSLVVYTDGVPESNNIAEEMYTTNRLLEVLNRNRDASMEGLVTEVIRDLRSFSAGVPQFDDITVMGLDYYGPAGSDINMKKG
ncbi:MAG: serine/threonine-protein phosphatase [Lachnospiraceae bacterium]|nr:serine/threonine-protein phosphatase [Lachnospiraceae bacterium]